MARDCAELWERTADRKSRGISVLVVDDRDHERHRSLTLIRDQRVVEVTAQTSSIDGALGAVIATHAQVAVIGMPQAIEGAIAACKAITELGGSTRTVVMTPDRSERGMRAALLAGASGYLTEPVTHLDLGSALRAVMDGWLFFSRPIAEQVRRMIVSSPQPEARGEEELVLTDREAQVLRHLGAGLRNREIAELMRISARTVEAHTRRVLLKLGATTRTQAAIHAVHLGLC